MEIKKTLFENDEAWRNLPVIAGPCSAETEAQTINTAVTLAENGVHFYRAGLWKPRTRPGTFEGVGEKGLKWLEKVRHETGMAVGTEVATPHHAQLALESGVDFIWIGARTSVNPILVTELAETVAKVRNDVTVLVKNPVNPDLDLWIGALQRFSSAGVQRLAAVHRGFSGYGNQTFRNNPLWRIPIELHRLFPDLTIICDPSHIGGKREMIDSLSRRALSIGYDGLIIETHITPDLALSDSSQQITPSMLAKMMIHWKFRQKENDAGTGLEIYRREIDELDSELIDVLSRRMEVSRKIGEYKRENDLSVVQIGRHDEVIRTRAEEGEHKGMNREFVEKLFKLIHEESVEQQMQK